MSAVIQLARGNVPLDLWVMVLPGLWFGAVLGMHLTSRLGRMECARAPKDETKASAAPALAQPKPCTVPVFWEAGPPVEVPGEKKAWNGLFLFLLLGSFMPAIVSGATGAIPWDDLASAWYMPLVGIGGCTLASSTPVGGAILFIPVLTSLDVPASEAVAFGVATQMIGMGLFATLRMTRMKLHILVGASGKPQPDAAGKPKRFSSSAGEMAKQLKFTVWVVLGGWAGVAVGFFALETDADQPVRFIFGTLESFFLYYVLNELCKKLDALKDDDGKKLGVFSHRSQWKERCCTGHDGCTAWVSARGSARLLVLLCVLLLFDIGRTFLWFVDGAK